MLMNLFQLQEWRKICDRGIINRGNLYRLKLVMEKARFGEAITIGFIGGSITAGALSSKPENCYAFLVYSWWKEHFPLSRVSYLNAGIGATTSQYGVARVEKDLLNLCPDIVIAEFSVNDGNEELYMETFEGLVRRILAHPKEPALLMFNNAFYDDGRNAEEIHNRVGRFYDLPIVSMKESIYNEIRKKNLDAALISPDNLHPNDLGHRMVAGVIILLLDRIYDLVIHDRIPDQSYRLPEKTLTKNRYFHAAVLNNADLSPGLCGFIKDETGKEGSWDVFKNGWMGRKSGSRISFEVRGSFLSVQYRKYAKHPAPVARLVIDHDTNHPVILDANFEEDWGDCLFLQDVMKESRPGKHELEITITTEAKGKDFYLASIITA